ncbi:MAG: hypothetical protein KGL57_09890 [Burkholderiales bacterium]|nr:hypothetical protein [Burkholderiales bacterium]
MDVWGGLIHIVNFFAPALGLALIVPSVSRLVWWRALKSVAWLQQVKWVALINAAVLVLGLLVLGRDGAMWTYIALVLASAGTVWWTGLR